MSKVETTYYSKFQNYTTILLIYVVLLPISISLLPSPKSFLTHTHQVPYLTKVY